MMKAKRLGWVVLGVAVQSLKLVQLENQSELVSPFWTKDEWPNAAKIPIGLSQRLEAWPEISAAEMSRKEKGKFVVVVANKRGLGNRMGPIAGGMALAVVTGRGLAIEWPRRHCHRGQKDCDPTGIDDLFKPPTGVHWKLPKKEKYLCSGRYLLKGNKVNAFESLQMISGLGHTSNWREHLSSVCFDTDRCFAWAISCNSDIKHIFPSPWITYGALLDYILRPSRKVQERISSHYSNKKTNSTACILGIHLRKEDSGKKPSSIWMDTKKNPDFDVVRVFRNHTQLDSLGAVYVAADDKSVATKRYILNILNEAKIPVISPIAKRATRSTIDGIIDAVAENFILSSCQDILPRGIGKSTFHDVAVARAAFRHNWQINRINAFVSFRAHEHRYPTVPVFCPQTEAKSSSKKQKQKSENISSVEANHTQIRTSFSTELLPADRDLLSSTARRVYQRLSPPN